MKYTNETQSGVRSQETIHRRTESVPEGVLAKPRLSPPLPTPNPSRSTPTSSPFLHPYSFQFYPLTPEVREPIATTQQIGLIDTNGNDPRRQHLPKSLPRQAPQLQLYCPVLRLGVCAHHGQTNLKNPGIQNRGMVHTLWLCYATTRPSFLQAFGKVQKSPEPISVTSGRRH